MSRELQNLDANCNDCFFMTRDSKPIEERILQINEERRRIYGNHIQPIRKINQGAGHCSKFNKLVTFIPATCQIHTQECFKHRKA